MTSFYYRRARRKRYRKRKTFFIGSLCALAVAITGFIWGIGFPKRQIPPEMAARSMFFFGGDFLSLNGAKELFPVLAENEYDSVLVDWSIDYDQREEGAAGVPVLVRREISADQTISTTTSDLAGQPGVEVDETVRVLIYCTHTSEQYSDGTTVLDGAAYLREVLREQYGITAVVSETVHDSPEWYKSYANSRRTAAAMMEDYPDAQLLIDFHRDSGMTKDDCTISTEKGKTASLLLVVGSNMTMEHPNWEENKKTAEALGDAISAVNDDILRGVRVQKGRYNQHLTKNAVLLEVGTDLNSYEEVQRAVEVAAQGIAQYLQSQSS
ncbi:MAG: stage II sporulation protein P [Bacillota bacterium]|nr:stage II sporulation protein P [Bacillota bacterium]